MQRLKKLHKWASARYPETLYWENKYVSWIKLLLILLSIIYFIIIVTFLIFAENKLFALAFIVIFIFFGLNPVAGIGLTMALAIFQKGIAPLNFLNFPLFAICFSTTALIWIYRDAIFFQKFRKTSLDIWVMLFFFISALSTVFNLRTPTLSDLETLFPVLQFISLSISMGVFWMGKEILHGRKQISPILITILFTGIIAGFLGFSDKYYNLNFFNNDYVKPFKEILGYKLGVERIMSTFDNPNLLGMYFLYVLPLCFYLAYDENEEPKKWIMAVVSSFLLFILWLTDDVSSWIALSYGIALILIINLYRFVRKWIAVIAISGLLILGTYFLLSNVARGEGRLNILWPTAIKIFLDNPFLGVGMGNYYWHYKQLSSYNLNFAFHAHNLYLQILAERGILALIFFVGVIVAFMVNKIKYLIIKPKSNYLITSLLLAVVSTLISGMMQFPFSWIGLELHFWLYLLITISVIENHMKLDI